MMGCFQGHFLTQSSNTILIQTTQTISQFILVSTYVYFTTQNGPKRQNNKSQFIFLKVECWVLKNHNCFVLYLNCNLLFSRNSFLKNATYFKKIRENSNQNFFSGFFFHVSQVVRIKCTRLRLGLFYVFFGMYNL